MRSEASIPASWGDWKEAGRWVVCRKGHPGGMLLWKEVAPLAGVGVFEWEVAPLVGVVHSLVVGRFWAEAPRQGGGQLEAPSGVED